MHRFRAGAERGLFEFDKIADLRPIAERDARSEMSIGTDRNVFTNLAIDNNASFQHNGARTDS